MFLCRGGLGLNLYLLLWLWNDILLLWRHAWDYLTVVDSLLMLLGLWDFLWLHWLLGLLLLRVIINDDLVVSIVAGFRGYFNLSDCLSRDAAVCTKVWTELVESGVGVYYFNGFLSVVTDVCAEDNLLCSVEAV